MRKFRTLLELDLLRLAGEERAFIERAGLGNTSGLNEHYERVQTSYTWVHKRYFKEARIDSRYEKDSKAFNVIPEVNMLRGVKAELGWPHKLRMEKRERLIPAARKSFRRVVLNIENLGDVVDVEQEAQREAARGRGEATGACLAACLALERTGRLPGLRLFGRAWLRRRERCLELAGDLERSARSRSYQDMFRSVATRLAFLEGRRGCQGLRFYVRLAQILAREPLPAE